MALVVSGSMLSNREKETQVTTNVQVSPPMGSGRRIGYSLAVVVNLVMLVVVQTILDRGWVPFLTDEFAEVVPWISLSLIAAILANFIYQFNDTPTVKSIGQVFVNLISLYATYQIFLVFPFDFSGYAFNWEVALRVALILAMVGAGIGVLVEALKLASNEPERREETHANDL